MKRILGIMCILTALAGSIYIVTHIPYYLFKQQIDNGSDRYVLYKNPLYYKRNIAIKTDPYVRINITKSSNWKWIITMAQKVYLPDVILKVVDKDTDEVFATQSIPVAVIQTDVSNNESFKEIRNKISDNYPYLEFFPYVSKTMIASYSGEAKKILVTKKIDINTTVLLQELDDYLKQKSVSVSLLEQEGVVFTYSAGIDSRASLMQE